MTDRNTNWPVVLLVTALVASLAYCWYLRGEVDLRDRREAQRELDVKAAEKTLTDTVAVWRMREAEALATAKSAISDAAQAQQTILLTEQWYDEHRRLLPHASADSLKDIILWRTRH